jgi:hypothetical protein
MIFSMLLVTSCKEEKTPLVIPSTYSSSNFDANVTVENSLRAQLNVLSVYMKKAENVGNKLVADSLTNYFSNNGAPSLKSITAAYYSTLIESSYFPVMVASSQNAYDIADGATATNGGVYGARLLDKRGKETLQEVEKGLYAAALYNHLVSLTQGSMTEANVDKMIRIYGAHASFPNTNTLANTSTPDAFIALYTARRDKNDGTGFYTKIRDQFIKLQAAVKAGSDYNDEKNEAIAQIKLLIEKSLMATVINYSYAAIPKFTSATPTASTNAGGIHDLSECVGFIHGFKGVTSANRKITDPQIDELLTLLNAPAGADASMYKFVTDPVVESEKITAAIAKIKNIYGFTDAELIDFKSNWIAAQGR